MFKYEFDKQKVGAYLKKLIEKTFPSHRQFCKAYLIMNGTEPNDEELRKMSNRLSQILKGRKAIQTYDLPMFTELLGVSCEEILSCGKSFVPASDHITNYQVAFSKDPEVWKAYSERPDQLILNSDEYNKTVIDYAIEFKNYAFIKYLMDTGAIWFVDDSKHDCLDRVFGFGAGTDIKRRKYKVDLDLELSYHCEERGLRQSIIAMAMENGDDSILDELRAREIPALYQLCTYGGHAKIKCHDYYDDEVIEVIAKSGSEVIRYFTKEFSIVDNRGREHDFIYPFLNELIKKLIGQKSRYAEPVLRAALDHNKRVYSQLQSMINDAAEYIRDHYPDWRRITESDVKRDAMYYYDFVEEDGIASYVFCRTRKDNSKMCFNVVRTDAISDDFLINSLITELNDSFEAVQKIEPMIDIEKGE